MRSIQPLTRAASFSGPLSPSNTVLGKRRALADDEADIDEQLDLKRAKGCAVLNNDEWATRANKENIPPFARAGPNTASRRPTALSRRTSTGPGPGAAPAPTRLRRSVSYASPLTPTKSTSPAASTWAVSLPDDASSVSSSP